MANSQVPLPRQDVLMRWLRRSFALGAIYDLVFAALMVLAPGLPERLLKLPQPGETFYLWLMAIFLTMLAGFYFLVAYDPISYRGNIKVAIIGRTAGGLAMLAATLGRPDLVGLYPLALGDLFFAAVHAVLWWPIRR